MRKTNQKGFTLIELLVVVAIIGLLSSIVLISLNTARSKARDAKRLADVRQVASSLELYLNDCGSYPMTSALITLGSTYNISSGAANANCTVVGNGTTTGGMSTTAAAGTTYISSLPAAPTPADGTCPATTTIAATGNPYGYQSYKDSAGTTATVAGDTAAASYKIAFCLGGVTGGYPAGAHTLTPNGVN